MLHRAPAPGKALFVTLFALLAASLHAGCGATGGKVPVDHPIYEYQPPEAVAAADDDDDDDADTNDAAGDDADDDDG